jgi:hypothetical protein
VFDIFLKYHLKILVGAFNTKEGKVNIFKPTIENESLHEINNDNAVRLLNFDTNKILNAKSTKFPHRYIHKCV